MNKGEKIIPTVVPGRYDLFEIRDIEWKWQNTDQHRLFHINRLEDVIGKIKFPLPPHRKVVHDMILLTDGESSRSKGLNKYQFGKDELFFLPKLNITSHDYMSDNARGYYVYFDPDIFSGLN